MKLSKVHVGEFRSVWDSNEFEVGDAAAIAHHHQCATTIRKRW